MGLVAILLLQVGSVFAMARWGVETGPPDRIAERSWPRVRRRTAGVAAVRRRPPHAGSGVVSRGSSPRRRLLLAAIRPVVAEKRKACLRRVGGGVLSGDVAGARTHRPQTRPPSNPRRIRRTIAGSGGKRDHSHLPTSQVRRPNPQRR